MENIRKSYPDGADGSPVLHGLTLRIEAGSFCAITGASGSGKTTLLNILGLLDRPDEGRHLFLGQEVDRLTDDARSDLRNYAIGFIFQSFHLLPALSILDNVGLPLTYRRMPLAARRAAARPLLDRVGLGGRAADKPETLSGGQKQRVAIARALAGTPRLVLADEPTGNLDAATAGEIMGLLEELNRDTGTTVLIITHDPAIAARCRRHIRIRDGVAEDLP